MSDREEVEEEERRMGMGLDAKEEEAWERDEQEELLRLPARGLMVGSLGR